MHALLHGMRFDMMCIALLTLTLGSTWRVSAWDDDDDDDDVTLSIFQVFFGCALCNGMMAFLMLRFL